MDLDGWKRKIYEKLELEILISRYPVDRDIYLSILDMVLEVVLCKADSYRVAGAEYPTELVRERFLNLDSSHVEYVAECMKDNTTRIRNIKQYMLTALFNAPATKDSFYRAEVRYDLCQGKM